MKQHLVYFISYMKYERWKANKFSEAKDWWRKKKKKGSQFKLIVQMLKGYMSTHMYFVFIYKFIFMYLDTQTAFE